MGHATSYIAVAVTGGSQGIPPRETAFGRVAATERSPAPGSEAAAEIPHLMAPRPDTATKDCTTYSDDGTEPERLLTG